ncbi:DivIVA domain-containing protein [Schaalia sp. lx-260]|uniref:DivIVA domain-containing protein n=1 Tax=Schaalia sp. lx-260 TaxID=2899082 RepID=UPI001E31EEEF|nr:DivIVA domain-containing protein [Schaalia sp. lx-260]MCD4549250.1 DivIVA domain-containing protein [Schaalia sp. lx-260]
MALLTTEDVLAKKFQYVKFREGYDQVEVDEFLDEVVSTIYTLQTENQDLKEKLEAAERRIAELSGNAPETVSVASVPGASDEALEAAERRIAELTAALEEARATQHSVAESVQAPVDTESATSMLALAQRVHDEYVRDGREESERIISEARTKGDEIVADAQNQHQTILAQLDHERGLLEEKINELRGFESEYRTNLRSHLEGLLAEVSNSTVA